MDINQIKCHVCNANISTASLLNFENVPVSLLTVYKTEEKAKNCIQGNINLVYCQNCGFIFNADFETNLIDYSEEYNNNPLYSTTFVNYLNDQMEYFIKKQIYKNNLVIVESGCGKGFYIDLLADKLLNCSFYGFDTIYEGEIVIPEKNIKYYKSYFPSNEIEIKPDIIISRHVIEHIQNPIDFIKTLKRTLPLGSVIFIETPNLNWILENKVIFDIFYEHCNYWTISSISNVLNMLGFEIIDKNLGFGGQHLWIVAKNMYEYNKNYILTNELTYSHVNIFSDLCNKYKESIELLSKKYNKIALYGAGAKGCTFVNLFDQNMNYISVLIDINPEKHNKFVPKTMHKIISPSDINKYNINLIILLNPNYIDEMKSYLYKNNLTNIDIVCSDKLISL
jgi:hypothetical protein